MNIAQIRYLKYTRLAFSDILSNTPCDQGPGSEGPTAASEPAKATMISVLACVWFMSAACLMLASALNVSNIITEGNWTILIQQEPGPASPAIVCSVGLAAYSIWSPRPDVLRTDPSGAFSPDAPPRQFVGSMIFNVTTSGFADVPVPWQLQLANPAYQTVLEVIIVCPWHCALSKSSCTGILANLMLLRLAWQNSAHKRICTCKHISE